MSNAAQAAYRKARALELALAGYTYDEIAQDIGLANRGTAWRMVQNALQERRFAAVDAYIEGSLERSGGQCGLWAVFQVLAAVGHVMDLVARVGADEETA